MKTKEVQLLAILAIIATSIIGMSIWSGQNSPDENDGTEHRIEQSGDDADNKDDSIQITSKDLDNFLYELGNRNAGNDIRSIASDRDKEKTARNEGQEEEKKETVVSDRERQTPILSPHIPTEDHLSRPPGESTEDELALTAPEDIPLQASSEDSAAVEEKGDDKKVTYTVQSGDTLGAISVNFYGTARKWQDILDANKNVLSSPRHLRVGMELVIPNTSDSAPESSKSESASVPSNAVRHTVKRGEYLSTISLKYYNTSQKVNKIIEANDSIDNADDIRAGVTIIIPDVRNSEITKNDNSQENSRSLLSAQRVTDPDGTTHIVKSNDTLWSLANRYYNDPQRYVDIIEANEHISSQGDIDEGMEIIIPKE